MLCSLFAAALLLAPVPGIAAAAEHRPRVTRGDGFIRSPVNALPDPAPKLSGRQNEIEVANQRSGTRYAVDVSIGTPPQEVTLILDTGSPDTWFNPSCETANVPRDCRAFSRFDYTKSSSFNSTRVWDILVYGIGNATIEYAFETLTIGSATIEKQIIGIARESHMIPLGILGLSPPLLGVNKYPYVLDTMVDQGLIKSRAFSLDLRGVDNPNGAIIFGGIDTGKYIGELAKLPMLPPRRSPRGANRYYVTMTGVGLTLPSGRAVRSRDLRVPVFLDSGSTFSYLPTPIYEAIALSFRGAQFNPLTGHFYVPCGVTELDGSVDFYFGAKAIRVPLNDFIWQIDGFCILGVLPGDDEPLLGDTFLRAAYVVFDQDNRNLHIAQAANCGDHLVAIGSGPDAVPSSTGRCTELPTPTAAAAATTASASSEDSDVIASADDLDVTATRTPSLTFTGFGPTDVPIGPGPAAPKTSDIDGPLPTDFPQDSSRAGRGAAVAVGAAVGVGVVNVLAWLAWL